jgi:CRP/FNR family transcriptional regulator, cyclic AMP receptor protein
VQEVWSAAMARKSSAYLDHLRSIPLFAACSSKDLQKIAAAGDEITVPAGSVITDQGQMGREAFVVIGGSVTVRRNGKKVATLGPGAVIGELSLLDHGPRTATVVADTDTSLFVLDQRHFAAVIDEVPSIAHKIMASLAAKIREFDRQYYG